MGKYKHVLPAIPAKRYFSISETSHLCDVKPYVLRYWEQEFAQIKPCKRSGGRRYYQANDIKLIRTIRELLYFKKYTIAGAKKQINLQRNSVTTEKSIAISEQQLADDTNLPAVLQEILTSLQNLLQEIRQ